MHLRGILDYDSFLLEVTKSRIILIFNNFKKVAFIYFEIFLAVMCVCRFVVLQVADKG